MTRLPLVDRALLAASVPLWALCFALSLAASAGRVGYPPIYVAAGDPYPLYAGVKGDGDGGELRPGDRLVRLGGVDLAGFDQVGLSVLFADVRGGAAVPLTYERAGEVAHTRLVARSHAEHWPRLLASAVFAAAAIILMLRAAPSEMIRTIFGTYMAWALLLACTFAGGAALTAFSLAVQGVSLSLAAALGVRSALLFPQGAAPPGALARWGPWLFLLLGPLDLSRFYELPFSRSAGVAGETILGLLSMTAIGAAVVHNYRRAGPIQRRQIKWFLFGVYCAALPSAVASLLAAWDPTFEGLLVTSVSWLGLVPIFLLIAVARYNLFDIDRLISVTASYTILGILALAALLAAVPRLAYSLSEPIGIEPETAQLALSALLAVVIVPLQRLLRPRVDQVFFAERYALERGFEKLLDELSACREPHAVTELAGMRLYSLLRPASLAIYMRGTHAYAPAFVRGRATPVAFDPGGPLIAVLRARGGPVTAERTGFGRRAADLSAFDRAAIETLGVPLIVPVRSEGELAAFFCLGPKGSGDVYTTTDLAMLSAVADKVASELLRFDQAEVIRQGREMQDALRRYVPSAVAEEIASGHRLDVGERELSVLFVDIRNYTGYSEHRAPREVFAAVNRYTEAVSEIVRQEGGSVVEFNGDGVMAVFGAPRELPDKEHAAVSAARRIVETVDALALGGRESLAVGAGIATGNAYVGNVRSADRFIWTALGHTTNLASRLQGLSRELGASIVIDTPTWQRAGEAARGFAGHERVAIRGQSVPSDVYVLPLRGSDER